MDKVQLSSIPETPRHQLIETLTPKWPLEALLDEFDFLIGYDLSESLLSHFESQNRSALPSALHHAVTQFYNKGLTGKPLCITSNWDTLQEKDFRNEGYKVIIAGPGKRPGEGFGQRTDYSKSIFVYHPHGSFETRDVICSFKQEHSRLPNVPRNFEFLEYPTLFLGYSGYEPSLYEMLQSGTGSQLWCIRDESDFEIPAKRRLLCRPHTFVYIGDMQELLRGLGVLENDVEFTNIRVANPDIPPRAIGLVQLILIASLDVEFCIGELSAVLVSSLDEPEATIRYASLMKVLVNHIRNRVFNIGILPTLIAAARFHESEQLWITTLAYLLRISSSLDSKVIDKLIRYSDKAFQDTGKSPNPNDDLIYTPYGRVWRTQAYKSFVGHKHEFDEFWESAREFRYQILSAVSVDPAMSGEFMELLAFEYLREGKQELAQNCFDNAAINYYLHGLWNSGQINEWASKNVERLVDLSKANTLVIPIEQKVEPTSA